MPRVITALLALAVLVFVGTLPALAVQDQTHDGVVVSATEGKLVMSDKDGKNEHTHMVGPDAKVTIDAKQAKLADLKKGQRVKVTTKKEGDKTVVTAVAGTSGT